MARSSGHVAEVAATSKDAKKSEVEEVLGILAAYEARGTHRWKSSACAAA